MDWILLAFIAPLLWAISNFIDKILISKYFKGGSGTLIVYSCLIGLPVALIIFSFKPDVINIDLTMALLIVLSGAFSILYLFPYFSALKKADTSSVIPVFQTIPVITYFLAYFVLGEVLTKNQIIASLLIIGGAIGISSKFENRKVMLSKGVLLPMILASLLVSLNGLFFKIFAIALDFWTVSFWEYVGAALFGIISIIFVKSYRKDFASSFKRNGKRIISLNLFNESINVVAILVFSYAILLAPISLVYVINGFQPLFAFLIGSFLTIFVPHIITEKLDKKIIFQKVLFIVLMIIGAYLLGSG